MAGRPSIDADSGGEGRLWKLRLRYGGVDKEPDLPLGTQILKSAEVMAGVAGVIGFTLLML